MTNIYQITMNFFHSIHKQLQLSADKEIISWPNGKNLTGSDLLKRISEIQSSLPSQNTYVLLAQAFDFDALAIILACIANGNPVLFYPKNIPLASAISIIKEKNIKHAFVKNFLLKIFLKWNSIKAIGIKKSNTRNININNVDVTNPAIISFSSGSSGVVKCIERSHYLLNEQVKAIDLSFKNWHNKTDFPLFANILLYNLSVGKKTLIPHIKNFDLANLKPSLLIEQLINSKIESMTGNEYYFENICTVMLSKKIKSKSIKGIGIGGSPISNRLVEKMKICFPNASIQIIYGSTEAEPISIKVCEDTLSPVYYGYNVGYIHPSINIQINTLYETEINNKKVRIGEILVEGTHVAKKGDTSLLNTGDFGYILNNELYLTARQGNTENIHGIQHLQLEHCIKNHLDISVAIIIKDNTVNIYTEDKISINEIEKIFFIIFNIKLPIKMHYTTIPKDKRQLSKVLYHKIK